MENNNPAKAFVPQYACSTCNHRGVCKIQDIQMEFIAKLYPQLTDRDEFEPVNVPCSMYSGDGNERYVNSLVESCDKLEEERDEALKEVEKLREHNQLLLRENERLAKERVDLWNKLADEQ